MKSEPNSNGSLESSGARAASPALSIDASVFKEVTVGVEAKLGRTIMTIRDILALQSGSVVKLDLKMNEPIELCLNDVVVARGDIVAVDDSFGLRVTELAQAK